MTNLKLFIPIIFLQLILAGIYAYTGIPKNNIFFITNLLILLFSFFGMFLDPLKPYSLSKVVFIFIFIFFGFVPLLHETSNFRIYGNEFNIGDRVICTEDFGGIDSPIPNKEYVILDKKFIDEYDEEHEKIKMN